MKLAIITTRTAGYFPNRRLIEEAKPRGHQVELWHPYRVWPVLGDPAGPAALRGGKPARADVALPRVGSQIGDFGCALIEQLERMGIPVVNRAASVRLARNKFLALQALEAAGLPVPPTCLVGDEKGFSQAQARLGKGPWVAKELSSRQGRGVILLAGPEDSRRVAQELVDPRVGIIVQKFIPPEGRKDYRLFVLGGRVAAAASLSPNPGDFRANFHLAGRIELFKPSAALNKLAVKSARALGLDIAGVDLMVDAEGRPWLAEVNYSPGFRGLEMASGLNLAGMIWDHVEAAAKAKAGEPKRT